LSPLLNRIFLKTRLIPHGHKKIKISVKDCLIFCLKSGII